MRQFRGCKKWEIPHGSRAFPERSLWKRKETIYGIMTKLCHYEILYSAAVASRNISRIGDNGFRRLVSLGTFYSTWFNGGVKSG